MFKGREVSAFHNKAMPGPDWVQGILQRQNKIISPQMTEYINSPQTQLSAAEQVQIGSKLPAYTVSTNLTSHSVLWYFRLIKYFDLLEKTLENVPPENILNFDETAINNSTIKKKFLDRRHVQYLTQIEHFFKSNTINHMCGSAVGVLLPPFILYKSELMHK